MRFAVDRFKSKLAVGNINGSIFLFDLVSSNKEKLFKRVLEHSSCLRPIRQIAFSSDSTTLIAVGEDATICRWDLASEIKQE